MRLKPLAHRVLVKPHTAEEYAMVPEDLAAMGFKVKMGMDDNEIRRSVLSLEMGWITDIGPNAWMHQDMQGNKPKESWTPWAKVGDQVIFGKYTGKLVRDPDDKDVSYLLMNDEDIQAVILQEGDSTQLSTEDQKLLEETLNMNPEE